MSGPTRLFCSNDGLIHYQGSGLCTFETACGCCDTGNSYAATSKAVTCRPCLDVASQFSSINTPSAGAPADWEPLPEVAAERRMFDQSAKVFGDVRVAIAQALAIFAVATPGGSFAASCNIMANEVAKLRLPPARGRTTQKTGK